jgi:hypothetical protein
MFVLPGHFKPETMKHEAEIFRVIRQTRILSVVLEKPNSIEHNTRRPSLMGRVSAIHYGLSYESLLS